MEFWQLLSENRTVLQETGGLSGKRAFQRFGLKFQKLFSGRSATACPPQTGFNAFAFLAFILMTIDTIMNINNNLNNNNNSNNNNDRNNNNNNMFESMNMNERRSFQQVILRAVFDQL